MGPRRSSRVPRTPLRYWRGTTGRRTLQSGLRLCTSCSPPSGTQDGWGVRRTLRRGAHQVTYSVLTPPRRTGPNPDATPSGRARPSSVSSALVTVASRPDKSFCGRPSVELPWAGTGRRPKGGVSESKDRDFRRPDLTLGLGVIHSVYTRLGDTMCWDGRGRGPGVWAGSVTSRSDLRDSWTCGSHSGTAQDSTDLDLPSTTLPFPWVSPEAPVLPDGTLSVTVGEVTGSRTARLGSSGIPWDHAEVTRERVRSKVDSTGAPRRRGRPVPQAGSVTRWTEVSHSEGPLGLRRG